MKRHIFLFYIFSALAITPVFAQNLSLSDGNGPIANNATIQVWGDSGYYNVMYSHIAVANTGSAAIEVLLKKTEISVIPGTENSFCWGQCYGPAVFVSPSSIILNTHTTDTNSFAGEYKPMSQIGATTIRYTFYDKNNVNDSVAVYVVYNAGTASIASRAASVEFSNAYPNPASSVVSFNYNLQGTTNSEFVITDLLGGELFRTSLQNENAKLTVDVSTFSSGVYFYSVRANGKIYFTRKLIVRH